MKLQSIKVNYFWDVGSVEMIHNKPHYHLPLDAADANEQDNGTDEHCDDNDDNARHRWHKLHTRQPIMTYIVRTLRTAYVDLF